MDQIVEADPPAHERIALIDLNDKHCRWPIGHVGEATFGFCGRQKHTGPYCEAHAARAFRSGATLPKGWR